VVLLISVGNQSLESFIPFLYRHPPGRKYYDVIKVQAVKLGCAFMGLGAYLSSLGFSCFAISR
jgi:hypothetical protein